MRIAAVISCLGVLAWAAQPVPIHEELDVRVPMRDGVHLSTNVFRPAESGRFPVILVRTPYGKGAGLSPNYRPFVEHGYALVVQDVRGRYASEGDFEPLRQESNDGEDTLNWAGRQPWSNGRVGMIGGSYLGIVQWKAALLGNPYLKAIFPVVSGDDDYFDRFYSRGGALKLGQRLLWMSENVKRQEYVRPDFRRFVLNLPLHSADRMATGQTVAFYQEALEHPSYDAFWESLSTRHQLARVRVPVFSVGGWYDNFVESDFEAFQMLRGVPRRIVVGPWPHNMAYRFPGVDFGPQSSLAVRGLQFQWFDYWLKSSPAPRETARVSHPPVRIFVMGANRWRDEEEWPIARAKAASFYLSSRGRANSASGDGSLAEKAPRRDQPDQFVYDPRNPVPTAGGAVCCNPKVFPWGPLDQREIEKRRDVLVYTSRPLKRDLEVTGPVKAILYVSTSAPDTDFTAKLVDVFPDGSARILADGILRLRYRASLEKPVLAVPGEVHPITIDVGVTSNVFLRGHRIRLDVSSSNFPRFDRNPNTGRAIATEVELRRATQTVYHDAKHASRVLLPVIPSGS